MPKSVFSLSLIVGKHKDFRYQYSIGQKGKENKKALENIGKLSKVEEVYHYKRDEH